MKRMYVCMTLFGTCVRVTDTSVHVCPCVRVTYSYVLVCV
jgi:hypothetical protein